MSDFVVCLPYSARYHLSWSTYFLSIPSTYFFLPTSPTSFFLTFMATTFFYFFLAHPPPDIKWCVPYACCTSPHSLGRIYIPKCSTLYQRGTSFVFQCQALQHWTNVVLLLVHWLWQWPNIKLALVQRLMSAGLHHLKKYLYILKINIFKYIMLWVIPLIRSFIIMYSNILDVNVMMDVSMAIVRPYITWT